MKAFSSLLCLVFLSIASLACHAQIQTTVMTTQPTMHYDGLAKKVDWGEKSVRLFQGSNIFMKFRLATSWIPGPDDEGLFRFKLSAFPQIPAIQAGKLGEKKPGEKKENTPEEIAKYVQSASKCNFGLVLNDQGGFKLRTIMLSFTSMTNSADGRVVGLVDNSSSQMDADQYQRFVGNKASKGSWQIIWRTDCSLAK